MNKSSVNGLELAYESHGKGMPMVLLHGYPLDHTIWESLLPRLKNDFDLILPDLRGFGELQAAMKKFSMADCAADVAGLLEQLGIQKAAIVGHSMGGYVALAFARTNPGRLLGLGLVSSQALADTPEKKAGRNQEAEDILINGVRKVAEGMSVKLTAKPDLRTRLKELILRQRPEGLAGALRAMAERPDSTALLAEFDFPVAIVHGMEDQLIPIERARELQETVKKGYLVEIKNAGHMPMMETPKATAEALIELK